MAQRARLALNPLLLGPPGRAGAGRMQDHAYMDAGLHPQAWGRSPFSATCFTEVVKQPLCCNEGKASGLNPLNKPGSLEALIRPCVSARGVILQVLQHFFADSRFCLFSVNGKS